jgi:hypothetical protein
MFDSEMLPRRAAHAAGSRVWFYERSRASSSEPAGGESSSVAVTGEASLRGRKERHEGDTTGAMGNGNGEDRLARQETSRDGARGRGDGGAAGFDERPGHLQRCVRLRVGSRRRALVVCGILDVWLQDARRCDSPQLAVRGLLEGAAHAAASVGWSLSTGKPARASPDAPVTRFCFTLPVLTSCRSPLQPLWGCLLPSDRRQYYMYIADSTSLQIEDRPAQNPAQSLAIPTSTPHATQRIPKKQAAGMPTVPQTRL